MDKEKMYTENEKLVYFVGNKYRSRVELHHVEDLFSELRLALWKSILNFDGGRGCQLSTFACKYLFQAASNFVSKLNRQRTYALPDIEYKEESCFELDKQRYPLLYAKYTVGISVREISETLGLEREEIEAKINSEICKLRIRRSEDGL